MTELTILGIAVIIQALYIGHLASRLKKTEKRLLMVAKATMGISEVLTERMLHADDKRGTGAVPRDV